MIKAIDWITNYNGFIGTLTKPVADAWAMVIRENVPGVLASEVDAAVASLCNEERAPNAPKPNARTIIGRIKAMRYTVDGIRPTSNHVTYYDGAGEYQSTTMAELKGYLNRRPPADVAWDVICTPMDNDQCKELRRYCDNNGIVYEVFKPDVNIAEKLTTQMKVAA